MVTFLFEGTQQTLDIKRANDSAGDDPWDGNSSDPQFDAMNNATTPYRSVISAFGRITKGTIGVGFTSAAVAGVATPSSTLVQSTGLNNPLSADNATLAHAMEEMFRNITSSLISDP